MPTQVVTVVAHGTAADVAAALIHELRRRLDGAPPAMIAMFASTQRPLGEVAREISVAFPSAMLIGASTAGELTKAVDQKGSTVALALAGDRRVHADIGVNLKADPERARAAALERLARAQGGGRHAGAQEASSAGRALARRGVCGPRFPVEVPPRSS
jgi:hypothetical protein